MIIDNIAGLTRALPSVSSIIPNYGILQTMEFIRHEISPSCGLGFFLFVGFLFWFGFLLFGFEFVFLLLFCF